ncbi:MAG TPA: ABC transporter ATP-binding protein, partial [Gemmatimonadales bacterium]|nr:ABC transporter ATP-binding protein [Gemmatimonadales bacterium]
MTGPALELRGIRKEFRIRRSLREALRAPLRTGRITALDGISLDVAEGEFFGVLGENGAGKTTLFKILSTLTTADAGTACIFGIDVAREQSQIRHLLAPVLVSDRSLAWRLSALENLRLYGGLHRLGRREADQRAGELLTLVGLADTGARLVGTFSSGMKQRLLLARALMARPRMLLLDEPTRSLDPVAARSFREFLRRDVGRSQGCTVILATHDPDEVRDLCDRVGVLHQGRLVAMGTVQALSAPLGYHRYRLVTRAPEHPAVLGLAALGARLGRIEAQ